MVEWSSTRRGIKVNVEGLVYEDCFQVVCARLRLQNVYVFLFYYMSGIVVH